MSQYMKNSLPLNGCATLQPSILTTSLNLYEPNPQQTKNNPLPPLSFHLSLIAPLTYHTSVLLLAIIPAHVPQIRRIVSQRSTDGFSPHFIPRHFGFSTFFLCFLLGYSGGMTDEPHPITCIASGHLVGFDALGVLMPLLQVALQWLCALIMYLPPFSPFLSSSPISLGLVVFLLSYHVVHH
jgi:hypothetical protein